MDFYFAFYRN